MMSIFGLAADALKLDNWCIVCLIFAMLTVLLRLDKFHCSSVANVSNNGAKDATSAKTFRKVNTHAYIYAVDSVIVPVFSN